uniref:Zinc finger protein 292-like n=1 Tax=Salarias fasciatus TaxID=181472 RepID=A0A672FLG5_SALFA
MWSAVMKVMADGFCFSLVSFILILGRTCFPLRTRVGVVGDVLSCPVLPLQTLLEYAGRWKVEEDPLPLVEVYIVGLLSYAQASQYLSLQCENVPLVAERLSLSFLELLLSLKDVPDGVWQQFKLSVQFAHSKLEENGMSQLSLLSTLGQYDGVWTSSVLQSLLSDQMERFLVQEGPVLLEMRVKQLMKEQQLVKAARLAKTCAEALGLQGKGPFKQIYLVCLCATSEQDQLMEQEDCREVLEMICNLESEGDDRAAFSLCSAFLTRQLLQGDTYCAWELTLFWSKLLKRLEPSEQTFLNSCRQMSLISKTVYHILFLIKVIQSEVDDAGLPVCIEMCMRALRMDTDDGNMKATVCKTVSCLLPNDLEVKRACQLTEFLLEPTVDSYYAVETLYNEPDQKLEEESMPIPNSLRCDLLLVFKTQWPFDPEFWDWKTLKRHCLALMGEEASIVSSIDLLNDTESPEEDEDFQSLKEFDNIPSHLIEGTYDLDDMTDKKRKNREMKKLREKGFISARFRNWQAYMQYCVLCDKEFLGHRIVRHAQIHQSGGIYTCPICAQTFSSKDTLIPHVTSHVKQSCKERLTAMKTSRRLAESKTAAPVVAALTHNAQTQNGLLKNDDSSDQKTTSIPSVKATACQGSADVCEGNVCPVGTCRRSFKFLKNLIAHVKTHRDDDEAKTFLEMQSKKVICQYCRRHFISVTHLNNHLQVHCGAKPYICIQLNCKASFLSNAELLVHKKTHSFFRARCMFPNCGKIFNEAFRLYDHEAQHYKTFTCKVADCGKVFHSQQQLDLHQQKHVAEEESSESLEQPTQIKKPGPSLIEQMLRSPPSSSNQGSFQSNWNAGSADHRDPVRQPTSIEELLRSPPKPLETVGQHGVNPKPQNTSCPSGHAQSLNNSVIQSVHSHLSETTGLRDDPGGSSFDYVRPPQQNQPAPPLEAHIGNVLQSQPQMYPNTVNNAALNYSHVSNLPLPVHQGPVCSTNTGLSTAPQALNSTKPQPVSQPLPPTVNSQQLTGNKSENLVSSSSSTGPPPGLRERFHCALETCIRHYSTPRSVSKHMKAVHPDFYEQWKLARTKFKITYAPAPKTQIVGNVSSAALVQNQKASREAVQAVQRQNVIQSPPYANMTTGSNFNSQNLLPSPALSGSVLMSDVLNHIVVSQLRSDGIQDTAQSQSSDGQNWQTLAGGEQSLKCPPSIIYPPGLQAVPQASPACVPLPPTSPSCSMMAAGLSRPAESLQSPLLDSRNQPLLPQHVSDAKEMLPQVEAFPPYAVQMQSSQAPVSQTPEEANAIQNHLQPSFPSAVGENQNNVNSHYPNGLFMPENGPDKPARKSRRPKWPAIVKDGKFVCCRCFREFDNPRSLGGHLSKRAVCKPYDELELNTDLPRSFLDLLHSEQTGNVPQSQMSYNGTAAAVYQEKPHMSVTAAPSAATNDYSAPSYSQDDLPAYGSDEADDIFRQIMAESSASDLFLQSPPAQTLFQNRCPPFGATLPGSSVIQHTENVQLKQEDNLYSTHYPQTNIDTFTGNKFPNPLLTQMLTGNPSTAIPGSAPLNHTAAGEVHSKGYHSRTAVQTPDTAPPPLTQALLPDRQRAPPTGSNSAEAERKTAEQDIKKRLREQILSGDFQRRNGIFHSGSADQNPSSISLGPPGNSPDNSALKPTVRSANSDSTSKGKIHHEKCAIMPGTSGEIEQLLKTQSFTHFRDGAIQQQEVLSPMGTVANEPDSEPAQLSASQQRSMSEIQCAFEKLDLIRERADQMKQANSTNGVNKEQRAAAKTKPRKLVQSDLIKPYHCESEGCTLSFMTGDTLWRHLAKVHNYTLEMVNVVKKRLGLYAPFKCQKCPKAFTRNSNLRIHYQSAHKLSFEEIADLDMMRRNTKVTDSVTVVNQTVGTNQATPAAATAATHSSTDSHMHPYFGQDAVKQECIPQGLMPCPNIANEKSQEDNRSSVICSLQAAPMHNQPMPMTVPASQSAQTGTAAPQWPQAHPGNQPKIPPVSQAAVPPNPVQSAPQLVNGLHPVKQSVSSTPVVIKPSVDATKKVKERKPKSGDSTSRYRPYCCVHQGCVAAFTIQHNLILHYRAVHQSALSALEVNREQDQCEEACETTNEEEEEAEMEYPHISEFRCQVKDCCCVFQFVPNLFQHYVQLHKFPLDKIISILTSITLGKFTCGHQGCTESFTNFWKFIKHVKEMHKDIKFAKPESFVSFKCEIEGCDRSYATKSNLLRHTMKKHQDLSQPKLKNQDIKEEPVKQSSKTLHYPIPKTSNGKENIESNKKLLSRARHTKRAPKSKISHWAKYGKPSLKSKVEASAMCTKKSTLQYPCMIKGCESVMKSERHIVKHYIGHGLSAKYLEQQRSHFIFCKKFPKQRCRHVRTDDSKSDNTSDLSDSEPAPEAAVEAGGGGENDSVQPILRRRATSINPIVLIRKMSSESTNGTVILKRKRGRPKKFLDKIVKRKKIRLAKADAVTNKTDAVFPAKDDVSREEAGEEAGEETAPLSSFKPMGFEVSFLKFLERSNQPGPPLTVPRDAWRNLSGPHVADTCVWFSNPGNLKPLGRVRIHFDAAFASVSGLMLKQLQGMQPAVVLTKTV